jgi:hypothetical protein
VLDAVAPTLGLPGYIFTEEMYPKLEPTEGRTVGAMPPRLSPRKGGSG